MPDPYNMYWSPDGRYAIVVAEAYKRLDFRDPATMRLVYSIETPDCAGINHADFSIDGTHALFTCEFDGGLTKVDLVNRRVVATIKLSRYFDRPDVLAILQRPGRKPRRMIDPAVPRSVIVSGTPMPQDIRASPDGRRFYVADMVSDGVHVVDFATFRQSASSRRVSVRMACIRAATARSCMWPTAAATTCMDAPRQGQRLGDRVRERKDRGRLGRPRWWQPGYGQCERGRALSLALWPL